MSSSSDPPATLSSASSPSRMALPLMMFSVVMTATMNTISRRIALVPLANYPYFLTQLQTLCYLFFYWAVLGLRYQQGNVTKDMMRIPKAPFFWIGLWDSIGDILGNVGTSHLPGYYPPLLAKTNLVFTAVFSWALLHKRYSTFQLSSMLIVICGSVFTLIPTLLSSNESSFSDLFYAAIYVSSVAPTALAFVLKEQIFRKHDDLNLDIFVVNSFGAVFGLVFSILLLPLASIPGFGKVNFKEIPSYFVDGFSCFTGTDPAPQDDCTGSPLAPFVYMTINLLYNICFLILIKHGGALLTFITNTVTFPIATILFTLPWPLLGSATLNIFIVLGLFVELTGILIYHRASLMAQESIKLQEQQEARVSDDTAPMLGSHDEKPLLESGYGSVKTRASCDSADALDGKFCYNQLLRRSIECKSCNSEDICKCLLSPRCNCG